MLNGRPFGQARKLDSERQLQDLSERMEELLQEKQHLEIKNRILVKDLSTWQDHVEELWGREVPTPCLLWPRSLPAISDSASSIQALHRIHIALVCMPRTGLAKLGSLQHKSLIKVALRWMQGPVKVGNACWGTNRQGFSMPISLHSDWGWCRQ